MDAAERDSFYHQVDSPAMTILPLRVYQGESFIWCVVAVKRTGKFVY